VTYRRRAIATAIIHCRNDRRGWGKSKEIGRYHHVKALDFTFTACNNMMSS
jgi:hypothetical protein